jgi:hypothetical protein
MLPELPLPAQDDRLALRAIAGAPVHRAILAATRTADAARPSTRALLGAVRAGVDRRDRGIGTPTRGYVRRRGRRDP